LQAHFGLQCGFGHGFAAQVVGAVARWGQSIRFGVPHGLVHTVQDARQVSLAVTQQAVQAVALLGLRDFAGIGGADGGQHLAVLQTRFHERHVAVKLQPVHGEQVCWQAQRGQHFRPEQALVGQVVDGEHGSRYTLAALRHGVQVGRAQAGVPVVAVNDIGLPTGIQSGAQLGGGPAQPAKPAGAVWPRLALGVGIRVAGLVKQAGGMQQIHLWRDFGRGLVCRGVSACT
jgi:hypothetical protein